MAWPNMGQPAASTAVTSVARTQTPKKALNASIGPERRLRGGGGMAVGSLRNSRGVGVHPQAARTTLTAGIVK